MRLCLLGDSCGKTSLVQRWIHPDRPIRPETTVAIDMKSFSMFIDKKRVVVQAWDCSGNSAYDNLLDKYIFNSSVTIICFDLTSIRSWEKAKYWIKRCHDKPFCLIGNKLDRESEREVKEYIVRQHLKNAFYYEVSASTGENCKDALQMIVRESMRNTKIYTVRDFKAESSCFVM
mgnify:CR=1 FL=1